MGNSDDGTIVLGWLTRLTVVLGLIGVIAFDVMSLTVTRLGVADDATSAAVSASRTYQETHSVDRAYEAALDAARRANANDTITAGSFNINPDGHVSLTVQREAVTVLARYIPSVKEQLVLQADGSASPV